MGLFNIYDWQWLVYFNTVLHWESSHIIFWNRIVITCEFNVKLNLVSSCKFVHHIHTRTHREKEKSKKEIVDPPMFIDFQPGEDTFDRQVYKEYTQMGTKVKFLVWPALWISLIGLCPKPETRFLAGLEHTYQSRNNVKTTNEFVLIYNILN
jgi:hypothetical protein